MRTIIHLDMDAFFASVEQRDNPHLLNKPIAITGSGERTVLVSPSYDARSFGVKTGMTKYQARKLCPEIVFVSGNTVKYTKACKDIIKRLYTFTPDIEIFSIDEFFLDITDSMHLFGSKKTVAKKAQSIIKTELGLDCSIGIAHNKLLAKFASERAKPAGIFTIEKNDVHKILDPSPVDELCGIGKSTTHALNAMGIETIAQLRKADASMLKRTFGVNGLYIQLMAKGIGDDKVIPMGEEQDAKSLGHSMTFSSDTSDPKLFRRYLLEIADLVGRRLRREGLSTKTIRLTVRYKSFKTFTKQKTFLTSTDDTKTIYDQSSAILRSIKLKEPIRLLGITASKLTPYSESDSLFTQEKRKYKLNRVLDDVNERFGNASVLFASLLEDSGHSKVISPAWRPSGNRNY